MIPKLKLYNCGSLVIDISFKKVQSTQSKTESELLNAVNYIKNISKKNVTIAKIEPFMRKKELFTCKKELDNTIDSFIENDLI